MHQHPVVISDEVGMEVLDLKVIDSDWGFKQLMLDLLKDNVFAVDGDKNISRAERISPEPALTCLVERVRRRGG